MRLGLPAFKRADSARNKQSQNRHPPPPSHPNTNYEESPATLSPYHCDPTQRRNTLAHGRKMSKQLTGAILLPNILHRGDPLAYRLQKIVEDGLYTDHKKRRDLQNKIKC